MTSAEIYAAMVEANEAQQARLRGPQPDRWGGETAARFRVDPRRPLDRNLEVLASYLGPDDVLVDVGGGAGRVGLPMALRCREVINAEPSPGMQAAFQEVAKEAGILNVRSVESDWLQANGVEGDVCLTVHVTYFVREIVPFIRKLEAAARKRVIIGVNSVPIPNSFGHSFEALYNEPNCPVPGHRELLSVLWDMGRLPDVRVLPDRDYAQPTPVTNKEEVVSRRLALLSGTPEARARAEKILNERFDEFYVLKAGSYVPRAMAGSRGVLITWEPQK